MGDQENWAARWKRRLEAENAPSTVRTYLRVTDAFGTYIEDRGRTLRTVDAPLLQAFLDHVGGRTDRSRTLRLYGSALRTFGRWAVAEGLWSANFAEDLDEPAEDRTPVHTLSPDDAALLLREGPEPGSASYLRDVVLLRLAVLHGLKTGELARLTWDRVPVHGKGGVLVDGGRRRGLRDVQVDQETLATLRRLANGRVIGPVFEAANGRAMVPRQLLRALVELGERAGLQGVNFSALRYAAVTETLAPRGPLAEACEDLGFAHPSGALRAAGRFGR